MPRKKLSALLAHITGWSLFLSLPLLFMAGQPDNERTLTVLTSPYYWLFAFTYMAIFYFHSNVLFPRLYSRQKIWQYFLVLAILLAGSAYLRPFESLFRDVNQIEQAGPPDGGPEGEVREMGLRGPRDSMEGLRADEERPQRVSRDSGAIAAPNDGPPEPPRHRGGPHRASVDIISIFLYLLTIAMSLAVQTTQRWRLMEQRITQAEAEKANAELSFLKAQINPHFLFNTLNNLYSLAMTGSNQLAASIMKLSNIMRYVTDDVTSEYVSLEDEIDCVKNYIDLQRLRLSKKVSLELEITGDASRKLIAPLILMPFIENVFKHGISNHEESHITIRLETKEKMVTLFCRNQLFPSQRKEQRTGIGIANTIKRLELVYPEKHQLHVDKSNGFYTVQLSIEV